MKRQKVMREHSQLSLNSMLAGRVSSVLSAEISWDLMRQIQTMRRGDPYRGEKKDKHEDQENPGYWRKPCLTCCPAALLWSWVWPFLSPCPAFLSSENTQRKKEASIQLNIRKFVPYYILKILATVLRGLNAAWGNKSKLWCHGVLSGKADNGDLGQIYWQNYYSKSNMTTLFPLFIKFLFLCIEFDI